MSVSIQRGDERRFVVTITGVTNKYLPADYGSIVRERLLDYMVKRVEWRRLQAVEAAVRVEYPVPGVLGETRHDEDWYENGSVRLENAEKQTAAAADVTSAASTLAIAATVLTESLFPGTWRYYIGLETAYIDLDPQTSAYIATLPEEEGWVGNMDWKCRVVDGALSVSRYP